MHPLLAQQQARARELIAADDLAWMSEGASEEHEQAWSRLRLRPRVLRDVSVVDTSVSLLGTRLSSPVLVGPTAAHGRAHPEGEVATWQGSQDADCLMVWAMRSSFPVAGPCWWQAYVLRDRSVTLAAALEARDAGAAAIVLTGDTPYLGTARRPPLGEREQAPAVLADIEWLASATGLPVLVKGILRADDAEACVEAGAAGIVVSNHGGRQFGRAVPTALALPEIACSVGGRVPVLVDGGLRSGLDVLCALALGADAVLLGKPVLWALASGGAPAVTDCLRAMTDDLAFVMGLAGCRSLAEIDRSLIAEVT